MAIFQPTNIIPSSFTQGTVDVNDNMEISWQVNGNSAMTAFQIDFYLNDTASTFVYSTGKLPKTGETQAKYNLPFYGTDRFGRPQFFTYNAEKSWAQASMLEANPFTNGNNYKFKITQWYKSTDEVVSKSLTIRIGFPYQPYFSLPDGGFIYFYTTNTSYAVGTKFYYNSTLRKGWIIEDNRQIEIPFVYTLTEPDLDTEPNFIVLNCGAMVLDTSASNESFVTQESSSIFVTRQTPMLTLYQTDDNYGNGVLLPNSVATSIGYFQAIVTPTTEIIRWIRWQIATANNGVVGDILVDTGDIYTPTLNFEFNGFFNGNQYAIRCFGESESGQATNNPNADSDGWQFFNIDFVANTYDGNFTAQCLHKENATLLEWEGITVIPPTVSPAGYSPQVSNGSVKLSPKNTETNEEYSVTWDRVMAGDSLENMSFSASWTVALKEQVTFEQISQRVSRSGYTTYNPLTQRYQLAFTTDILVEQGGIVNVENIQTSSNVIDHAIGIIQGNRLRIILYSSFANALVAISCNAICQSVVSPTNTILNVRNGSNLLTVKGVTEIIVNSDMFPIEFVPNESYIAMLVCPDAIHVYYFNNIRQFLKRAIIPISLTDWQNNLTSITLLGGDSGATVDSVSIYQGDGSNILSLYENPDFEPAWNSSDYQLYMTANFNGNLEGGTGTSSGKGFQIYRQEVGKSVLTPIATVSSTTTSLKDYGISSRKAYKYSLYAYDSNGAFMSAVEADNAIATNFKNYSLLVCDYDYDKDEYHVRKQYLFALNLSAGSVGNNNSPTLNANFTQYPTRMPSTQNYASGTLSGLIGAIYTVPALIEQIGQYKYTAKPSTLDYFDSVDLEKELYDLSTAPYQLFLRDMKGRLRMIHTNGAISMTTNIKQRQQSISISFPWVEIGDASDVTIIQTPDDYGWNNDNQVLDVQLDVDVATGELSAKYPFPYNGTTFYLTGVNKENLTAKTPLGVTPAQFNLSDTATETTDGEVTATVTVNSEVDE